MNAIKKIITRLNLKNMKLTVTLTHVLAMTILFVMPEFMLSISDRSMSIASNFRVYIKAAIYVVVFYANYSFIINRTLSSRHGRRRLILLNIPIFIIALSILHFLKAGTPAAQHIPPPPIETLDTNDILDLISGPRAISFLRDFIMLVLTVSLSIAIKLTYKFIEFDRLQQESRTQHHIEELHRLKSQLQPHFLFNTLNTIYALIDISPDTARKAIHRLSGMLRYVLYENPSSVTLSQELEFVDNYTRLMRLRLSQSMPFNIKLDAGTMGNAPIAPLIFINLIENAFKYGNTGLPNEGIDISITADTSGRITCTTHNYIAQNRIQGSEGVGLRNLTRRLELLYGADASLETNDDGKTFTAKLIINLKQPST